MLAQANLMVFPAENMTCILLSAPVTVRRISLDSASLKNVRVVGLLVGILGDPSDRLRS